MLKYVTLSFVFSTLVLSIGSAVSAQAPLTPAMIETPMVSAYAGIPVSTYNGTTAGSSCASTTVGYITANDGCPALQTQLGYTYSAAMDLNNNLAVASYGLGSTTATAGIQLVYQGGAAMKAALIAAKPSYVFTPLPGHVYQIANGPTSVLTARSGTYYCSNVAGSAYVAEDAFGNGCPAQYVNSEARATSFDADGNLFFSVYPGSASLRVMYVGGSAAANLITTYFNANCANWPVTATMSTSTVSPPAGVVLTEQTANICTPAFAPKPGYVYALSAPGDFVIPRGIGVSYNPATGAETIFANDNATQVSTGSVAHGLQSTTAGNQIKQFTGTGWITAIPGAATGGTTLVQGDGSAIGTATAASSATVVLPNAATTDRFGNYYFEDTGDSRIRVIYVGGTTAPLYIEGANSTVITNPLPGHVYSVAGGGTLRSSPNLASALSIGGAGSMGVDPTGNLYFIDSNKLLWVDYVGTGQAINIGGAAASTTSNSVSSAPGPGVACNGSTSPVTGPIMTDGYADGCPATEVTNLSPAYQIAFDTSGNFYIAETRQSTAAVAFVRKYSYNSQFGAVATGSSLTNPVAFTPRTRTSTYTSPTATYTQDGNTSKEFFDAGGDSCSTPSGGANLVQTCVFNVTFQPALAGARFGGASIVSGSTPLGTPRLSGVGAGAQISIDPANASTIGTGLSPSGVAVDQSGNAYISDNASGSVYKSVSGAAPVKYATGFSAPGQIAVAGNGTLFVADTGHNRIAYVTPGTTPIAAVTFLSVAGSVNLNKPLGVAVDVLGDLFVADTGNNRVIEMPYDNGIYYSALTLGVTGLNAPMGLAVDSNGNLFIADSGNGRVVEWSIAGVQSAVSVTPSLFQPVGVSVDPAGDLFVADAGGGALILIPAGASNSTVLKSGVSGLNGIAADSVGDVFASATSSSGLIELNRSQISLAFPSINIGSSSSQTFTLTNSGNGNLTLGGSLGSSTDGTDYTLVPATTNGCSAVGSIASGGQCVLSGVYAPQSVASALTDVVTFPASNAANPATVTLAGPSQMGLSYVYGTAGTVANTINVMFTATLSAVLPSPVINGSVTFVLTGPASLTRTVAVSAGGATLTAGIPAGVYSMTATYIPATTGGTTYGFTVTNSLTFTVVTGTSAVALSVTAPSSAIVYGNAVVVSAVTSTGNSSIPATGTVTFTGSGTNQGTLLNLPSTTVALASSVTDNFPLLQSGTYTVTASYSGDANYIPSQSTITFIVAKAMPSFSLVATSVAGAVNTVTLTATASLQPTYPTGSVSFFYGTSPQTSLGSAAPIANGVASQNGAVGLVSNTFSAVYGGDFNYLPATVTVAATPLLVLTGSTVNAAAPSTTTITVLQQSVGTVAVTLTPFFNYSAANITYSCSGLPLYTTCELNPSAGATSVVAGQTTIANIEIFTDTTPVATNVHPAWFRSGTSALAAALFMLCCLPSRRHRRWSPLAGLLLASSALFGLSGCGTKTSSTTQYITPVGTYAIQIKANDGTSTYSMPYVLIVGQGPLSDRPTDRLGHSAQ